MLKKYPAGSDLTLINTIYSYPKKDGNGKWSKDKLTIIFKDNVTGIKHCEEIESPEYSFYIAKEDQYIDHNMLYIEKDKVDKVTVPYKDLQKTVAEMTGNLQFYYDNINNGNRSANGKLFTHPKVFLADQNIEDHYRFWFSNTYTNSIIPITKAFFDIEADTINMKGDFPEMGECPINAVSVLNEVNKTMYVLLLRNKENSLIEDFENSIDDAMFTELKEFVKDKVGGWKNEKRYKLDDLKYEFMFYDEEIQLIQDLFVIFNVTQPDFILAWNMGFDMPYIIERIKVLGYIPEDIICHTDFTNRRAEYYIDTRNDADFSKRGDYATVSAYSVYLDLLIHFTSRRRGQHAFPSYKLDTIGGLIAGVRKSDYSHITTSIAKLPWLDYKVFTFYNIMDTIVLKCIEAKTNDVDYVFNKCLMNNTRYNKCHRQTVYLVNRGTKEFYNDGLIIGCNTNKYNEKAGKYEGAFVADPRKIDDYAKVKINGNAINVMDNMDDYDYKALYPSEMGEFNIAPNTQIGYMNIPNKVFEGENKLNKETYNRGGAFAEDLQSHVYLEFCTRWFNFADYGTLYKDVIDYYTNHANPSGMLRRYNDNNQKILLRFINAEFKQRVVSFSEQKDKRRLVSFNYDKDFTTINNHYERGNING